MARDELLVEVQSRIATITLNRPERRNSLSASLLLSLPEAINELADNGTTRCIVLKGAGDKAFCAGMDLRALSEQMPDELLSQITAKGPLQQAIEAMESCRLPLIAMISGYALGAGLELTLGCDLRVGAEGCIMGMPPVRLGIVYAPEGLARFIRNLGLGQAKKLFLTSRYINGREAYEMGLLHYVMPDDQVEKFTYELAEEIAGRAPLAVGGIKRSLQILTRYSAPGEAEQAEMNGLIEQAALSSDAREALSAFNEKRKPDFKGT
ncbi:MAG: hypothetical protein A2W01_11035 [Candidatus Solincola sediminis]|uniref:Enoyl-CoA hydratase n=1 Tax=Candidatus Solincola sediminis TaxID=1797199 RepID=A0A1F2WNY6_9ACTN|nr:MAG: hypothetical protein A2Y75_10255 [Candidatus Solincola sediminis]OFW61839.1 MAG: hypothetical protein A2W01_11035 [Candidatus Solincola sediminis]